MDLIMELDTLVRPIFSYTTIQRSTLSTLAVVEMVIESMRNNQRDPMARTASSLVSPTSQFQGYNGVRIDQKISCLNICAQFI